MMQFCVLGSGSGGNATIVRAGETVLLVDAGFSAARLRDKMKSAGVEPDELDAILLTHEHADHMKGVHQFTRKHAVRVYATRHTAMCVQEKAPEAPWAYFEKGQSFRIGDIVITPFPTYHDAVDPVGFKFETERSSLGFISDTGQAPGCIAEYLAMVDSLVVESNYDPDMLGGHSQKALAAEAAHRFCARSSLQWAGVRPAEADCSWSLEKRGAGPSERRKQFSGIGRKPDA